MPITSPWTFTRVSHSRTIKNLQAILNVFNPLDNPFITQGLNYLWQATQFAKMTGIGDVRGYDPSAPSSIDEETLASVVAYATFDDNGGTGTPVLIPPGSAISDSFTPASFTVASFGSSNLTPEFRIPLLDGEGRTAYYKGHYSYLNWNAYLAPEVTHTKQFMVGHCLELNVPGTVSNDQKTYAYYDSHANFNVSSNISVSLWFYPTDWSSISSETYRYLLYRYIDASNYFIINLDTVDAAHPIRVFVREGGTETKLIDSTGNNVVLNAWNLVNFTYNPSTNALVLYINGTAYTNTTGSTLSPPYTTDANMYIGGLPGMVSRRFTGYMDNFVMWSGKLLSAGEVTNMWTRGTIV